MTNHDHRSVTATTAGADGRTTGNTDRSDTLSIDPIRKSASLSQQAYEHIKAAIIAGEVEPGQLYSVNQFANLLGVSRTPVREALLALTADGLLTVQRNRGFQIAEVTREDREEIVFVRRLLEVAAMKCLAEMEPAPTDTFRRAREILADLDAAAKNGDLLRFLSFDRLFHLTLIDAVGNQRLSSIVADLRDHMHLPGLRTMAASGLLHETSREHLQLLEALENRDPDAAESIMSMHLDHTLAEWS